MRIAPRYQSAVYLDYNAQPLIVFAKGRTKFHAVAADTTIRLVSLPTLRGLREAQYRGEAYPPRRAASFWLNHTQRDITKRAKQILRGIVARKPRAPA